MRSNYKVLIHKVNTTGDFNDEIEAEFKKALEDFKANHTW